MPLQARPPAWVPRGKPHGQRRPLLSGKVAIVTVVGNEDGDHQAPPPTACRCWSQSPEDQPSFCALPCGALSGRRENGYGPTSGIATAIWARCPWSGLLTRGGRRRDTGRFTGWLRLSTSIGPRGFQGHGQLMTLRETGTGTVESRPIRPPSRPGPRKFFLGQCYFIKDTAATAIKGSAASGSSFPSHRCWFLVPAPPAPHRVAQPLVPGAFGVPDLADQLG